MKQEKKAVILLSGGLDSATTLAIARHQGYECFAITFQYGQRHSIEVEAAKRIARSLKTAEHRLIPIDLASFGGSALTDPAMKVPKTGPDPSSIPITYVPVRNLIFLSYALAWAEVLKVFHIFIGANAVDYSGYPDCRPEFFEAFQKTANLAAVAAVEGKGIFQIHTPIIHMTKAEIIKTGLQLGVDYSLTHSCYDPTPQGLACGLCDSCRLRKKGFREAGVPDPTKYVS
ncbi:MAG TPA: 7-cyano-7-deazaguanine synthase QueC [Anaerohalosphaeraceae bacterium]|nr:7-cyano-7-deazaguanine synthase QueC [Anaerohalosphaeraceae bacterium]HOL88690.1 7-cyano-7-deazaguanine synthase QueC [Anaerohalosphaeraceae bacterium]HPP56577.1 7-cyano-7-deazaguanine synthase QueC [Anaerohalosphaeraceae bacterium]